MNVFVLGILVASLVDSSLASQANQNKATVSVSLQDTHPYDSLIPVVPEDHDLIYRKKGRKPIYYCYPPVDATNSVVNYLYSCKSIFPEQASDLSKPYLRATYIRKGIWDGDACVTRKDIARETNNILKDWFCDTIPPFRMVMPNERIVVEGFPGEEEEMERFEDNKDFDKANKEILDEIDRILLAGAK